MTKVAKFSEMANFFKKQVEALEAVKKYKFVLYGGAMGGGKSYFLRWVAVYLLLNWAKRGFRNVSVGLFCEDYPALEDRHLKKIKLELPDWLGDYNGARHEFVLKPEWGSGVISFRNLDDVSKYKSAEFAAVLVDELTMNTREIFDLLRTRMRWVGISDVRFVGATNPGGKGHAWVHKIWMLKDFDNFESEKEQFFYVPSTAKDNPNLDKSYYIQLEGLPEDMRKAYLEGDWSLFQGQFFSEWRDIKHIIEPFEIPETWFKFRAIDYGRTAPFCCKWYAVDYDGNVYVYREYYQAGMDAEHNFKIVKDLSGNEIYKWTVLDSACFSATFGASFNRGDGETIADIAWKLGLQVFPSPKNRLHGWALLHQYLSWQIFNVNGNVVDEKEPMIKYFKNCVDSIRTIPSLVHDKNKPEDLDTKGEDHAADADSYFLQMLHQESSPQPVNSIRRPLNQGWIQEQNKTNIVEDTYLL